MVLGPFCGWLKKIIMKSTAIICLSCGFVLLPSLSLGQSDFGPINFDSDSDSVGSYPTDPLPDRIKDGGFASGNRVEVVDDESVPANPIGAPGNNSVLLRDTDRNTDARINYLFASPFISGTVEFNFVLDSADNGTDDPYGAVYLGSGVDPGRGINISKLGPNLLFMSKDVSNGTFELQTFTDGNNSIVLDGTFELGEAYKIVMDFDSTAGKWSGTINGASITGDGGSVSSFAYSGARTDLNSIEFLSGWSTNENSSFFIDDITVRP